MKKNLCKICRRQNQKLFLKGDRCFSPKCALVKRPYPPGPQKKKRPRPLSEYGKELSEKQKLQNYYGLKESQFARYIKNVLDKRGKIENAGLFLLEQLDSRLDNVVFKAGFARSRREARVLVNHSHFLVNKKPVDIPSFAVKKGDEVSLKENKKSKAFFKELLKQIKNYQAPGWLDLNKDNLSFKIIEKPSAEDTLPVDISSIFEFYSR